MAELKPEQAPRAVRDKYTKGLDAMQRNNLDYAIELFAAVVEEEPALFEARRRLRICQAKSSRARKPNALMNSLKAMGPSGTVKANLKKDPAKALAAAEKLMMLDALNADYAGLVADAAFAAEMPEVAVMTLEIAREGNPADHRLAERLGDTYLQVRNGAGAREVFQALVKAKPNDQDILRKFKNASAIESMTAGKWDQVSSTDNRADYRKNLKNSAEAEKLEQLSKVTRSADDAAALIGDYEKKIERDPKNLNYYRELARLYTDTGRLEDALAILEKANEIAGGVDPIIERAIADTTLLVYDHNLEVLQSEGLSAEYEQTLAEKKAYQIEVAAQRVAKYPNDLQYKYEYGVLLLERGDIDPAIQQFQQSQRNPQRRIESLDRLGRCFKAKGLYDLAADQLKTAAEELQVFDEAKLGIYYELGDLYEKLGQTAEALRYYKEIYARDIGFRDVSAKMQTLHTRPS
jgi:tetratricopeptide (TPR) repeat protein